MRSRRGKCTDGRRSALYTHRLTPWQAGGPVLGSRLSLVLYYTTMSSRSPNSSLRWWCGKGVLEIRGAGLRRTLRLRNAALAPCLWLGRSQQGARVLACLWKCMLYSTFHTSLTSCLCAPGPAAHDTGRTGGCWAFGYLAGMPVIFSHRCFRTMISSSHPLPTVADLTDPLPFPCGRLRFGTKEEKKARKTPAQRYRRRRGI